MTGHIQQTVNFEETMTRIKTTPTSATLIRSICRKLNIPHDTSRSSSSLSRFSYEQLLKLHAIIINRVDK